MSGLERPSNRVLVLFGATGDLASRKLFPGSSISTGRG